MKTYSETLINKLREFEEKYGENVFGSLKHSDEDGWFPDHVLGDDIWVLTFCEKKMIDHKLYWRLIDP